jgi:hypothetical protein
MQGATIEQDRATGALLPANCCFRCVALPGRHLMWRYAGLDAAHAELALLALM